MLAGKPRPPGAFQARSLGAAGSLLPLTGAASRLGDTRDAAMRRAELLGALGPCVYGAGLALGTHTHCPLASGQSQTALGVVVQRWMPSSTNTHCAGM